MKKTGIIMHVTAILIGASFAIASGKSKQTSRPQFYKYGDNYFYAGLEGIDYVCEWEVTSTCTYWYDETTKQYRPTKVGRITWLR